MRPLPLRERATPQSTQTHLGEGLVLKRPLTPLAQARNCAAKLATSPTRGEGKKAGYAIVKNGNGAPSVALNTTFTFWPIFSFSISQSTKFVRSDGPSFNVT
jgi:hypothetical protein